MELATCCCGGRIVWTTDEHRCICSHCARDGWQLVVQCKRCKHDQMLYDGTLFPKFCTECGADFEYRVTAVECSHCEQRIPLQKGCVPKSCSQCRLSFSSGASGRARESGAPVRGPHASVQDMDSSAHMTGGTPARLPSVPGPSEGGRQSSSASTGLATSARDNSRPYPSRQDQATVIGDRASSGGHHPGAVTVHHAEPSGSLEIALQKDVESSLDSPFDSGRSGASGGMRGSGSAARPHASVQDRDSSAYTPGTAPGRLPSGVGQ